MTRHRAGVGRNRHETKDANRDFEEKRLGRPFTVKTVDEEGTFEGHGAVFEELHPTSSWRLPPDWQDRIRPGAFAATLADHRKRGTLPAMLYMHERGNVIGAWREMVEDADGLRVKGQVAMSAKAPSGSSLYELLKIGALNAMSIGFRVTKSEEDEKKKVREIIEVELGELSIVDIPGIASARVTDVKSFDPKNIRHLEEALRDRLGMSKREAKALLAGGFKELSAGRDAGAEVEEHAGRDAAAEGDEGRPDAGIAPPETNDAARILHALSLRLRR